MKHFFIATLFLLLTSPAIAASKNECAIWLCMPAGFPSGCGAAHKAMHHRLRHHKSPLPSFSSCTINPPAGSGSHMESKQGVAAFVPAHRVCTNYSNSNFGEEECISWRNVQAQYIKGTSCHHNAHDSSSTPKGCRKTSRWNEVYIDGKLAGPTYYW